MARVPRALPLLEVLNSTECRTYSMRFSFPPFFDILQVCGTGDRPFGVRSLLVIWKLSEITPWAK